MVDVVVDQCALRLADGLLDGMKLLSQIQARPAFVEHVDDTTEVTLGAPEPPDDIGMSFVNVNFCHPRNLSSLGGYANPKVTSLKRIGG